MKPLKQRLVDAHMRFARANQRNRQLRRAHAVETKGLWAEIERLKERAPTVDEWRYRHANVEQEAAMLSYDLMKAYDTIRALQAELKSRKRRKARRAARRGR